VQENNTSPLDESGVLRRAISEPEESLPDSETEISEAAGMILRSPAAFSSEDGSVPDAVDILDMELGSLDSDARLPGKAAPLPIIDQGIKKTAFEELGSLAHKDRSVRGPKVKDSSPFTISRKRRSVTSNDIRSAQLSSLSHALKNGATPQTDPTVSRKNKISFEEEKEAPPSAALKRTGGLEMLRAKHIARNAAAVVFAIVVGAIVFLAQSEHRETLSEDSSVLPITEWAAQHQTVEIVSDTVTHYLLGQNVTEKAKHVWDATRVRPLMEEYYKVHSPPNPSKPLNVTVVSNRANHGCSELPSDYQLAAFTDLVGKFDDIILRPDGDRYLIDWEASVGYNLPSLSSRLEQRSIEPATMRVLAIPADYYNYQFSDRNRYQSFALKVEDDAEPRCFAYVDRQSAAFDDLMAVFGNRDPRAVAMALELRFPPGKDPVAEILGVVERHWALDPNA
jgi:hypothetical protein